MSATDGDDDNDDCYYSVIWATDGISFILFNITALHINYQISNDELLYNAAKNGDVDELKELLSKGASTTFKDEVH